MIIFKGKCYQDLVQLTLKSNRRFSIAIQIYQYLPHPQKAAINNPGGGGGTQLMFIQGGSAPRSNPLPFLTYAIFHEKGTPFVYLLLKKWYPFHTSCLELCVPFNCCKCTFFKIGINDKNRTFSRNSVKMFVSTTEFCDRTKFCCTNKHFHNNSPVPRMQFVGAQLVACPAYKEWICHHDMLQQHITYRVLTFKKCVWLWKVT